MDEAAVEVHLDRAAVSETVNRYFKALDDFDSSGVRSVLADDFILDAGALVPRPSEPRPVDEFVQELIARNWGFESTLHLHPNHIVEIQGDDAHVSAGMWASHIVGTGPEDVFVSYGLYGIYLSRTAVGWRMTKLEIRTLRTEGGNPARIYEVAAERQASGRGH